MKFYLAIILAAVLPYSKAVSETATATVSETAPATVSETATATVSETDTATSAPFPPLCVCAGTYWPVCGTDGVTYPNVCYLRCANAERRRNHLPLIGIFRVGPCPSVSCPCPANIDPVCASNGRTFNNRCALACENKRRAIFGLPPLKIVSIGECRPRVCFLSNKVRPVCGTDGVTYRNIFYLLCASLKNQLHGLPPIFVRSYGACRVEYCDCTANWKPVCGSDGRTYRNICRFRCANRRRWALGLRLLTIRKYGPC